MASGSNGNGNGVGSKYVVSVVSIILAALCYFIIRNDGLHTSFSIKDTEHDIKIQANRSDIDWLKLDINDKLRNIEDKIK